MAKTRKLFESKEELAKKFFPANEGQKENPPTSEGQVENFPTSKGQVENPLKNEGLEEAFDNALKSTETTDIKETLINKNQQESLITKQTVIKIINTLADNFTIQAQEAMTLIFILFLKGAASKGAPDQLAAEIIDSAGDKVTMRKGDLLAAYKLVTHNAHLRRMAEFLATNISNFAETNEIPGDLFQKINLIIQPKDPPLSIAERSWCSSFNQKNNDCLNKYPRVYTLLAVEYTIKFKRFNNSPNAPRQAPSKANQSKAKKKSKNPRKNK